MSQSDLQRLLESLRTADGVELVPASEYALTGFGEELRVPVISLGLWGLGLMSDGVDPATARTDMVALCMTVAIAPGRLTGLALECDVDAGERFSMTVGDGALRVRSGPSPASSPTPVACDSGTFLALSLGHEKPSAATEAGRLRVDGDAEAVGHLFDAFAEAARRHTAVRPAPLTA
ncbi:alkyl sulfatase C-terminal domain-containing protein [Streptomyces sp. NPDC005474]|uniref:alkyl sulfatase C-terminal domain-containing protein n=1 Tax=Streptomyces sp. NPDC005474 TaxID=3154878 RepID=UPI0034537A72